MTFVLAPLGSVPGVGSGISTTSLAGASAISARGVLGAAGTQASGATSSVFGSVLTGAVNNLERTQANADALAVRAVTGDLEDVHEYTVAATEAKLTMELTAAVRNKAVDAFNEILRMQA